MRRSLLALSLVLLVACMPEAGKKAVGDDMSRASTASQVMQNDIFGQYVVTYVDGAPPTINIQGHEPTITIGKERIHFQSQCIYADWTYKRDGETLWTAPFYEAGSSMCARSLAPGENAIQRTFDLSKIIRRIRGGLDVEGGGHRLRLKRKICAASSCGPIAAAGEQGPTDLQSATDTVQLKLYERRHAKNGEVLVPPVLLRLSGTLGQKNGCLIMRSGIGDHVLAFEKGKATFDATRRALIIGSASFGLEESISVGGPFNQPAESFDPATIKERCGVNAVWLVTGADVRSDP